MRGPSGNRRSYLNGAHPVFELPSQFVEYIEGGGLMFFETSHEFGGMIEIEELSNISQFNQDIEIETYAPGYVAFATDGGGEAFAFDAEGKVYLLPMIGMTPEAATKIEDSWGSYLSKALK